MAIQQMPLAGMQEYEKPALLTPMALLQLAIEKDTAIDVIERLAILQREERQYQANVDFDNALNSCQQAIGRIAPNQKRNDTGSSWSDYANLDRTIRPIYTAVGFSVSYSQVPPITPGKIGVRGTLSRAGISRDHYYSEITPSTTGPKGGVMATATDADAIAASRAKRYVLLDMFNIAVGIDKEEKHGIPEGKDLPEAEVVERLDWIAQATDNADLKNIYTDALRWAQEAGDKRAEKAIIEEKNKRWKVLNARH
jgi:hypothetical protein